MMLHEMHLGIERSDNGETPPANMNTSTIGRISNNGLSKQVSRKHFAGSGGLTILDFGSINGTKVVFAKEDLI